MENSRSNSPTPLREYSSCKSLGHVRTESNLDRRQELLGFLTEQTSTYTTTHHASNGQVGASVTQSPELLTSQPANYFQDKLKSLREKIHQIQQKSLQSPKPQMPPVQPKSNCDNHLPGTTQSSAIKLVKQTDLFHPSVFESTIESPKRKKSKSTIREKPQIVQKPPKSKILDNQRTIQTLRFEQTKADLVAQDLKSQVEDLKEKLMLVEMKSQIFANTAHKELTQTQEQIKAVSEQLVKKKHSVRKLRRKLIKLPKPEPTLPQVKIKRKNSVSVRRSSFFSEKSQKNKVQAMIDQIQNEIKQIKQDSKDELAYLQDFYQKRIYDLAAVKKDWESEPSLR